MGIPGARPNLLTPTLGASHTEMPDPAAAGGTLLEMEKPAELSPGGGDVWDIVTPALLQAGVLREDDVILLIEFCESMAMAREFRVALIAEQQISGLGSGEAKRLRSGYIQSLKVATSLASEFGISPVARVRLGLAKVQGASLLQQLDRGKAQG